MKNKVLIFLIIIILLFISQLAIETSTGVNEINIVGSSSMQSLCEELVEEYKTTHPNVDINIQTGGSGLAIRSIDSNITDIGMCSKDVNMINKYKLGDDVIVICVNNDNNITDLSINELQAIFSGEITNWSEVGGNDGKINVITREQGSGTQDAFKSIVMNTTSIKKDAIVQNSQGAVSKSIAQDSNAIGFISCTNIPDDVKVIKINSLEYSDDDYPIKRPFLLLTTDNPTTQTMDFINWTQTEDAREIIQNQKVMI